MLITGVSHGLGAAIATEALARDLSVVGTFRGENIPAHLDALTARGLKLYRVDFNREDDIDALVENLTHDDVLPTQIILNAAGMDDDMTPALDPHIVRQLINVNLTAPLHLLALLLPHLQRVRGRAIAISSLSARLATAQGKVAYPASKAGLSMAFSALRLQQSLEPIRFVTVEPGRILETPTSISVSYQNLAKRVIKLVQSPAPPNISVLPKHMGLINFAVNCAPERLKRWLSVRQMRNTEKNAGFAQKAER